MPSGHAQTLCASQEEGRVTYTCRCSMLEIYNESVYDLLSATGEDLDLHLKPRSEEVYVRGLSWEEVSTGDNPIVLSIKSCAFQCEESRNQDRL